MILESLAGLSPSGKGNVSLDKTTDNVLHILAAFGEKEMTVVQGQAKPLLRPAVFCPEIHGKPTAKARINTHIYIYIHIHTSTPT